MALKIWKGPVNSLVEAPDSPTLSTSLGGPSKTRSYFGTHAMALAGLLSPGTIGTGDMAGWLVISSTVTRQRGGIGKLVNVFGAGGSNGAASGQALPPDKMRITPFEINPALEKNKRYQSGGTYPLTDADFSTIERALKAYENPGSPAISLTTGQTDLFKKKKRGQTNFYLSGFYYTWTRSYWWMTGAVNLGGYIETPSGPLATFLPSATALRTADDLQWDGTKFEYTCRWVIFPTAAATLQLDPDLY
jgi:hypothetical protein